MGMFAPAFALLFFLTPNSGYSVVSRQIDAPCSLIEERSAQYFEERGFYTGKSMEGDDIVLGIHNYRDPLTPLQKPLSLNRSSIHKYSSRHLSLLKSYSDFRLAGNLKLEKSADSSCKATLHFDISAFEWAWGLAVIDDGFRSGFISNGVLERLYLDSIVNQFAEAKP